jgi:type I restriction enzyme S subunit
MKLMDIATVVAGQAAPKEFSEDGFSFIRAGHLEELLSGVSLEALPKVSNEIAKKNRLKLLPKNSILFAKSGMSAKKNRIYVNEQDAYFVSHLAAIQPSDKYETRYLAHYLSWFNPSNLILDEAYPSIRLEDVNDLEIPLPDLATQQKIAAVLDKADELRQYNKQLIEKYDALTQSLFLDMFGDPVRNEKGWEKMKLGNLGFFKNGLNYSKSEKGNKIKVIGVGDFKNYVEIKNLNHITYIEMTEHPKEDFLLKDEDLLFVRSNGNKELIGRCLIVFVGSEKVSYSGFCIRFRKNNPLLNVIYLVQLFQRKEFKKHIFRNGRGANIQNINQELLSSIEIQLPPISFQNEFADRVQLIEQQKELAQQALQKSEELFNSLLQKAFKGELVPEYEV